MKKGKSLIEDNYDKNGSMEELFNIIDSRHINVTCLEFVKSLTKVTSNMTPEHQKVFRYYFMTQGSIRVIATIMKCDLKYVMKLLEESTEKFLSILSDEYGVIM